MAAIQQIVVSLQRSFDGLRVHVKVHPRIEEYFRTRAEDGTSDVSLIGRHWRTKEGKLLVYNLPAELASMISIPRPDLYSVFRMDRPGDRLVMGSDCINLSFLRLVGAGSEEGVSFTVPGVYPEDTLVTMLRGIEQANETFFRSFIKPVKVTSIISTIEREGGSGEFQEVRPGS